MSEGAKTLRAAVAAARDDREFKAVKLRAAEGQMEILWTRSMAEEDGSWSEFARRCGLTLGNGRQQKPRDRHTTSVVGLGSTAVAFYRLSAPAVEKKETEAMVRMQAESVLPLQADQIAVAWRAASSTNGQVDITMAAGRKDYLYSFADGVRDFGSPRIFLSCEGTVKAWQRFFSDVQEEAVLVSVGSRDTQVCLVRAGFITHAAVYPTGLRDLGASDEHDNESEPAEVVERFTQDIRSAIDSFSGDDAVERPILVLSDGSEEMEGIVSWLNAAGLAAQASRPRKLTMQTMADCQPRDIYEYRVPLGLALMALESPGQALDLFEGIDEEEAARESRSARRSVRLGAVAAVVMLVALVAVAYAVDVASEKRFRGLVDQPQFEQLREREKLLKIVARHRPDMLELLTDINSGDSSGIVLDGLHFKKGQRVTLSGQADNEERLWAFQQNLRGRKALADVQISTAVPDKKTKKIKFTMDFHYKQFTKKGAVL
jgi:hypothetical protein